MLLLQLLLFPLVHQAVQDNTVGCICVPYPKATQVMVSASTRAWAAAGLGMAGLCQSTARSCQHLPGC